MKKAFLIHGFQGSPNGGWRPWLMAELEKQGIYACALAMPTPNKPVPAEWVQEIKRHVVNNQRDQIYLIGHSLGVPAILRFLADANIKNVKGIILVSGPAFKTTKRQVAAFLKEPFDFTGIKSRVKHIVVIHGDNDRSVSLDQGRFLAEQLAGRLITIKNGGHLNGSSGFLKLPQCLASLNSMFK